MCEKYHLEKKDKWYEHAPDSVRENDEVKLLWDVNIQCDHVIEARRPDIVVVYKPERKCTIREIGRMWNMRTVRVVPIVVGSLGSVSKKLGQVAGIIECQK